MEWKEVLQEAKKNMLGCMACQVCNGVACGNRMPGPGAKGTGDVAIRNYQKWQEIRVEIDTLCQKGETSTRTELFGRSFSAPIFAGPVGAVKLHYGDLYHDESYNQILVEGCAKAGIAAFTGDGTNSMVMMGATAAISRQNGIGVPTIKPWNMDTIKEKMELAKKSGAFAVAMDIDAAGLPFLKNMTPPAGSKSLEEMKEIIALSEVPFIVKGIMTVKGAKKALEAGASGIVVSNHGGRVQDQCPATAEVLEEIADQVGDKLTVLVDGGIRNGVDLFKALAMGAKGVLIARPYVTAVYGGGQEGVELYTRKLMAELKDTMEMCGAQNLSQITRDMIRISPHA